MSALNSLDWPAVRSHYDERVNAHERALELHSEGRVAKFCGLILGISDPAGNYSASEHGLGPKVLAMNEKAEERVFQLAEQFIPLTHGRSVPVIVRQANLKYLRIGIGSEISCLMNPQNCWVANVRTIWTHLVIKHADNFHTADEELKLYRESDVDSEMAYKMWEAIHVELVGSMTRIAEEGQRFAVIANQMYEQNRSSHF